ncbi:AmmeMemoRadiSam system radical SAM enzyme [Archaeoglobus neptunius]|uniref:AmmeMemoRadiSam system radical SAM enzyme n=1 Tax=Archaeoglobus neptunius TaxID=2798580 RepID=UPI0019295B84|nr:AmmeMemoRadiSam system radical SAM enzyme [Archaeoglobus neptunius]
MIVESYLYEKLNGEVRCNTCWHRCKLKEGKWGICRTRKNEDGVLKVYNYGMASSIALDPIEKKPLNNFKPGTKVLSFGSVSCNFRCLHCQNYEIAFADLNYTYIREIDPGGVLRMCMDRNADGVAWTYNEPSIWHEFALDSSRLVKNSGFFVVYVTNGYMTPEAVDQFEGILDAANVDVKAFSERFYRKVCKASLENVIRSVEYMHRKGVFLELTYLIIPGENDDREEIREFAEWVVSVDARIPVHFSRFHPDFRMMDRSATPVEKIEEAIGIAKKAGIEYVYAGNVWGHEYENTYCPNCGELLIAREGFYVYNINVVKDQPPRCPNCGYEQNIIL